MAQRAEIIPKVGDTSKKIARPLRENEVPLVDTEEAHAVTQSNDIFVIPHDDRNEQYAEDEVLLVLSLTDFGLSGHLLSAFFSSPTVSVKAESQTIRFSTSEETQGVLIFNTFQAAQVNRYALKTIVEKVAVTQTDGSSKETLAVSFDFPDNPHSTWEAKELSKSGVFSEVVVQPPILQETEIASKKKASMRLRVSLTPEAKSALNVQALRKNLLFHAKEAPTYSLIVRFFSENKGEPLRLDEVTGPTLNAVSIRVEEETLLQDSFEFEVPFTHLYPILKTESFKIGVTLSVYPEGPINGLLRTLEKPTPETFLRHHFIAAHFTDQETLTKNFHPYVYYPTSFISSTDLPTLFSTESSSTQYDIQVHNKAFTQEHPLLINSTGEAYLSFAFLSASFSQISKENILGVACSKKAAELSKLQVSFDESGISLKTPMKNVYKELYLLYKDNDSVKAIQLQLTHQATPTARYIDKEHKAYHRVLIDVPVSQMADDDLFTVTLFHESKNTEFSGEEGSYSPLDIFTTTVSGKEVITQNGTLLLDIPIDGKLMMPFLDTETSIQIEHRSLKRKQTMTYMLSAELNEYALIPGKEVKGIVLGNKSMSHEHPKASFSMDTSLFGEPLHLFDADILSKVTVQATLLTNGLPIEKIGEITGEKRLGLQLTFGEDEITEGPNKNELDIYVTCPGYYTFSLMVKEDGKTIEKKFVVVANGKEGEELKDVKIFKYSAPARTRT